MGAFFAKCVVLEDIRVVKAPPADALARACAWTGPTGVVSGVGNAGAEVFCERWGVVGVVGMPLKPAGVERFGGGVDGGSWRLADAVPDGRCLAAWVGVAFFGKAERAAST